MGIVPNKSKNHIAPIAEKLSHAQPTRFVGWAAAMVMIDARGFFSEIPIADCTSSILIKKHRCEPCRIHSVAVLALYAANAVSTVGLEASRHSAVFAELRARFNRVASGAVFFSRRARNAITEIAMRLFTIDLGVSLFPVAIAADACGLATVTRSRMGVELRLRSNYIACIASFDACCLIVFPLANVTIASCGVPPIFPAPIRLASAAARLKAVFRRPVFRKF
jgi:hypothetical protein